MGLLGIIKAGGAYVPLDPPILIERAGVHAGGYPRPVLVTQHGCSSVLPGYHARSVYSRHSLGAYCPAEWRTIRPAVVTLGNLAYVIYTSGSTGRPKGVHDHALCT